MQGLQMQTLEECHSQKPHRYESRQSNEHQLLFQKQNEELR
jgi:hypothetical protein